MLECAHQQPAERRMDMGSGRGADNWIKDRPIFLERLLRAPAHAAEHFQCRASRRIYRIAVQVVAQREAALPFGFLGALARLDDADASTIVPPGGDRQQQNRTEEHTTELQSLIRIPYAAFCLKNK